MRINHNIAALNTYRMLNTNAINGNKALEKLSSGLRINKAADDTAGLAISEKMRAQVRGLDQASANAQDGISLIQTAEGGLNEVHSILQRVRELADQSANGTNTVDDRKAIQDEVSQLKNEINRIGDTTEFNTQKLLNGALQSSGASIGTNATTGSIVAKLTEATMTSAGSFQADWTTATYEKDTFNIDGHAIDVNWDTLFSQAQKDTISSDLSGATLPKLIEVKDIIVGALNTAIAAYNSTNPAGANVGSLVGYLTATTNEINLQSSTVGVDSQVSLVTDIAVASPTSVGALILSDTSGANSAAPNIGTSLYNGATIAAGTAINFEINGIKLQALTSQQIDNTVDMADVAGDKLTALMGDLQLAIDGYNVAAGLVDGMDGFVKDVKVLDTKDGRFVISDESGAITFNEAEGFTTIKDLGLTQAQTEAAGSGGMTFQIGANRGQTITFGINDMRTAALGIAGVDVSFSSGASLALTAVDTAIKTVSSERSKIGAVQNRLEHTINNLNTSAENLTAAESRIRDVDMAKEMMEFTKNNILSQAAQAMLAQANQQPQGVLQLLR